MEMSAWLEHRIEQAYIAVARDPQHNLAPIHRALVYNLLGSMSEEHSYRRRVRLELLTAQYVLPLWERVWPENRIMRNLIEQAVHFSQGNTEVEHIGYAANAVAEQLEAMWEVSEGSLEVAACFAGEGIIMAAFTIGGLDPFGDIIIDNDMREEDLDDSASDSAKWAAAALAGQVDKESGDKFVRREFWRWWLYEAIPTAYAA